MNATVQTIVPLTHCAQIHLEVICVIATLDLLETDIPVLVRFYSNSYCSV